MGSLAAPAIISPSAIRLRAALLPYPAPKTRSLFIVTVEDEDDFDESMCIRVFTLLTSYLIISGAFICCFMMIIIYGHLQKTQCKHKSAMLMVKYEDETQNNFLGSFIYKTTYISL